MSLHGAAPHGGLPHGAFDTTYSDSIADAVDALLEKPWLARSWWLRARPRDADTSTDPPTLIDVDLSTDGHQLQPTDPDYATLQELPQAIVTPYDVDVGLPGGPDLWGVAEMTVGLIVIGDPDTVRRHLVGEDWVGRQADVYVGPRGGQQVQFARVGQLLSREVSFDRSLIQVHADDYGFLFDRQIQENSYRGRESVTGSDITFTASTDKITTPGGGTDLSVFEGYAYIKVSSGANAGLLKITSATATEIQVDATVTGLVDQSAGSPVTIEGALEGGDDLKDRPIPILLGVEPQIEPVLVDHLEHIYQVHDGRNHGAMQAIVIAEDGKSALTFDADYADITLAAPIPGRYATCLATGHVKLGEAPESVLTVRAKGLVSAAYGYTEAIAGLIQVLAVDFAGLSDPGELDSGALTDLASHTAPMGHWTGLDPQSIRSVMQRFCTSAGAWAWLRPNKLLTAGRITDPDAATADFAMDAAVDLRESPWRNDPYEVPVGRVRVGYRPYSRTLSEAEVLPTVDEDVRKDAGKEYRFAKAEITEAERTQTPDAREITILTALDSKDDAQAFADEQLALRKTGRRIADFGARRGLIKRGIGDVFELTDDRLPTSPKKFVILSAKNRAEQSGQSDEITWRCFG